MLKMKKNTPHLSTLYKATLVMVVSVVMVFGLMPFSFAGDVEEATTAENDQALVQASEQATMSVAVEPEGQVEALDEYEEVFPSLTLSITADVAAGQEVYVGQTIGYSIEAYNNGDTTLSNVSLSSSALDLSGDLGFVGQLEPGEVFCCYQTCTVTESNASAGRVVVRVTVEGFDPNGFAVWDECTQVNAVVALNPSLTISQTASVSNDVEVAFGQEISYTVELVNNGDATIYDVQIADQLTGDVWTVESIAPRSVGQYTFKATHTVSSADVLGGSVVSKIAASGTTIGGTFVGDETVLQHATEAAVTGIAATAALENAPEDGAAFANDETARYAVTVENTGNVDLPNVTVTDSLTGQTQQIALLAAKSSQAVIFERVVSLDDLGGQVTATMKVAADDPLNPIASLEAEASVTVPTAQQARTVASEDASGNAAGIASGASASNAAAAAAGESAANAGAAAVNSTDSLAVQQGDVENIADADNPLASNNASADVPWLAIAGGVAAVALLVALIVIIRRRNQQAQ